MPGGVPSVTPLHLPIPLGNNAHTVWVEKPTAVHKSRSSREPEREPWVVRIKHTASNAVLNAHTKHFGGFFF